MKHIGLYLTILLLLFSCNKDNDKLKTALRLAGDNRPELEKVLDHYAQSPADSLKLRAAHFLIENMPGHYTLGGPLMEQKRKEIYNTPGVSYFAKRALDIVVSRLAVLEWGAEPIEDVRQISADFLIRHIDRSFERRERFPWTRELPFDMFLEYVLPYRIAYERLDLWIDSLRISPEIMSQTKERQQEIYELWNVGTYVRLTNADPIFTPEQVSTICGRYVYEDCVPIALRDHLYSRASGFPSVLESMPYYANRNGFHAWQSILSPEIKKEANKGERERRAAKIWRETFARQESIPDPGDEYVPPLFLDPFVKDVTDEYLHTVDVTIPSLSKLTRTPKYAYLCAFNSLKWEPAAISAFNKRSTRFSDIARGILCLPACFQEKRLTPIHYPICVNFSGKVETLAPDTTRRLSVRLVRKYPSNKLLAEYLRQLQETVVEADTRAAFPSPDTLLPAMDVTPTIAFGEPDSSRPFRYWRLSLPSGTRCAEIVFLDSEGCPLSGQTESRWQTGFDNDPLTSFAANDTHPVTVDFGRPVAVSRVVLLPRSDGNGIYPGDEYELFYHGLDGWRNLGRRVATDYFLDYDNLPAGALYWLHNHTRGVEERPFTITPSGDIRFW